MSEEGKEKNKQRDFPASGSFPIEPATSGSADRYGDSFGFTEEDETSPSSPQTGSYFSSSSDPEFRVLKLELEQYARELIDNHKIDDKIKTQVKDEVEKKFPIWIIVLAVGIISTLIGVIYYNMNQDISDVQDDVEQLIEDFDELQNDLDLRNLQDLKSNDSDTGEEPRESKQDTLSN